MGARGAVVFHNSYRTLDHYPQRYTHIHTHPCYSPRLPRCLVQVPADLLSLMSEGQAASLRRFARCAHRRVAHLNTTVVQLLDQVQALRAAAAAAGSADGGANGGGSGGAVGQGLASPGSAVGLGLQASHGSASVAAVASLAAGVGAAGGGGEAAEADVVALRNAVKQRDVWLTMLGRAMGGLVGKLENLMLRDWETCSALRLEQQNRKRRERRKAQRAVLGTGEKKAEGAGEGAGGEGGEACGERQGQGQEQKEEGRGAERQGGLEEEGQGKEEGEQQQEEDKEEEGAQVEDEAFPVASGPLAQLVGGLPETCGVLVAVDRGWERLADSAERLAEWADGLLRRKEQVGRGFRGGFRLAGSGSRPCVGVSRATCALRSTPTSFGKPLTSWSLIRPFFVAHRYRHTGPTCAGNRWFILSLILPHASPLPPPHPRPPTTRSSRPGWTPRCAPWTPPTASCWRCGPAWRRCASRRAAWRQSTRRRRPAWRWVGVLGLWGAPVGVWVVWGRLRVLDGGGGETWGGRGLAGPAARGEAAWRSCTVPVDERQAATRCPWNLLAPSHDAPRIPGLRCNGRQLLRLPCVSGVDAVALLPPAPRPRPAPSQAALQRASAAESRLGSTQSALEAASEQLQEARAAHKRMEEEYWKVRIGEGLGMEGYGRTV